jgi:hypothetical protein
MAHHGSKVLACTCKSVFQDSRYGKQYRFHNAAGGKRAGIGKAWRCTVCGNIKPRD